MKIIIAYGGNIPPLFDRFYKALSLLKKRLNLKKVSPIYLTEPMGYSSKPYLNALMLVEHKSPVETFSITASLEKMLGRNRKFKWSDRTVDLDLVIAEEELFLPYLQIPHVGFRQRRFWLIPFLESRFFSDGNFLFSGKVLGKSDVIEMIGASPPLKVALQCEPSLV